MRADHLRELREPDRWRADFAGELKRDLTDPRSVLAALGLLDGATKQAGGFMVCCPAHAEKSPSCSVQLRNGILQWHCFACDASGDVFDLIAAVHRLDARSDFRAVLLAAATFAGRHDVVAVIEGRAASPRPPSAPRPAPPAERERDYPPIAEVCELWARATPPNRGPVAAWLSSRGLRPEEIHARDLCRALPGDGPLPAWARCAGASWRDSGHLCLIPLWDVAGALRSLRARLVVRSDAAKCLTPAGCKVAGLVMADALAQLVLATGERPPWWGGMAIRFVVCEGAPDWLAACLRVHESRPGIYPPAVLGIESGAWTVDLAARIPAGSTVAIWTDNDSAGDKYAASIHATLADRCVCARGGGAA